VITCGLLLSNESRLSCGARKKDSFPKSTRAASFKRLLGGDHGRRGRLTVSSFANLPMR